ncbi:cytochrome p450 domain-containing protein [Purpureocillium lavendulum]|uniref:Cytochrome p450 domain-containing protein n=1 Tax=Purpureocillium lavendulum TaxID=1247861 RepID=A0AB34G1G8_9HYPO|nr:cytochrome p450 domain-containing protein [Purpureocillium lavendulum]
MLSLVINLRMKLSVIIFIITAMGSELSVQSQGKSNVNVRRWYRRGIYSNSIGHHLGRCTPDPKVVACGGYAHCNASDPDDEYLWAKYGEHGGSVPCPEGDEDETGQFPWEWGTLAHDSEECRQYPLSHTCGTDLYCKAFGVNGQYAFERVPRFRSREQCLRAHKNAPPKRAWEDGYGRPDSLQCRKWPTEKQCGSQLYCAAFGSSSGYDKSRVPKYETSEECFNARAPDPHLKKPGTKRKRQDGTPLGQKYCGITVFTAEECGTTRYCQLFPTTDPAVRDDFTSSDECEAAFVPRDLESVLDRDTYDFLSCLKNKGHKRCGTNIYCDMIGTGEVKDAKWKTKEDCIRGHKGR